MRRIRFQVAYRLDGCIAVPSGEHDWIIVGPEIDFPAMFDAFETV